MKLSFETYAIKRNVNVDNYCMTKRSVNFSQYLTDSFNLAATIVSLPVTLAS